MTPNESAPNQNEAKQTPTRSPFKIAFVVALLILAVAFLLVDTISARTLTASRMKGTMGRVLAYAREHDKLPETLAVLPATDGFRHLSEDAWNRQLDYSFDAAGVVTFRSLGADGRPGGEGDDRDMVATFNARDASGRWQGEVPSWKDDPLAK